MVSEKKANNFGTGAAFLNKPLKGALVFFQNLKSRAGADAGWALPGARWLGSVERPQISGQDDTLEWEEQKVGYCPAGLPAIAIDPLCYRRAAWRYG